MCCAGVTPNMHHPICDASKPCRAAALVAVSMDLVARRAFIFTNASCPPSCVFLHIHILFVSIINIQVTRWCAWAFQCAVFDAIHRAKPPFRAVARAWHSVPEQQQLPHESEEIPLAVGLDKGSESSYI